MFAFLVRGPRGADGSVGATGEQGDTGTQGEQGIQGVQGVPGVNAINIRSSNPGVDFDVGDLTADNAMHDMDISSIVGAQKCLVLFRAILRSNGGGNSLKLREKGYVGVATVSTGYTNQNGVTVGYDMWARTNSSGVVEYALSNTTWAITNITVALWVIL